MEEYIIINSTVGPSDKLEVTHKITECLHLKDFENYKKDGCLILKITDDHIECLKNIDPDDISVNISSGWEEANYM